MSSRATCSIFRPNSPVSVHASRLPIAAWPGDEFHHASSGADSRGLPKARNLVDPYGYTDEISVKTRDFR